MELVRVFSIHVKKTSDFFGTVRLFLKKIHFVKGYLLKFLKKFFLWEKRFADLEGLLSGFFGTMRLFPERFFFQELGV